MPLGIPFVCTLDTLKETPSLMNVNANVQEQKQIALDALMKTPSLMMSSFKNRNRLKQIETLYQVNKARCGIF